MIHSYKSARSDRKAFIGKGGNRLSALTRSNRVALEKQCPPKLCCMISRQKRRKFCKHAGFVFFTSFEESERSSSRQAGRKARYIERRSLPKMLLSISDTATDRMGKSRKPGKNSSRALAIKSLA